jgi:carbamoyltransferase
MVAPKKQYTLGISAFYHDSAAAILEDGHILAAVQEERLSRIKQDSSFPTLAVKWCLESTGLSLGDITVVAYYDKPFLKFERLLETYYAYAPKGLKSFSKAMPVWIKEKLFIKKLIAKELENINGSKCDDLTLIFPEHHLSHTASAFYPSPFEEAAILTIDGVGEWATCSIAKGRGKEIEMVSQIDFPNSVGLLYSAFTYYLGFKVNSGEYKLMGLAPYGSPDSERTKGFIEKIKSTLVDIKDDGSIWLDMDYFDFATGLTMTNNDKWQTLFSIPAREPESDINQEYMDMALAIQTVTEDIVLKMARHAKKITGMKNLCMAGGVALNCVANGKLQRAAIFDKIWIQPAAGDAGGALGAAYAAWHIYLEQDRTVTPDKDSMQGSYLGPQYSTHDIKRLARGHAADYKKFDDFNKLCEEVARLIADGKVVGWFQGRAEWGPRALGNRSILADPRSPEMQKKLNIKIKFREGFRPFAPAVLIEDTGEHFQLDVPSPYMLLVSDVAENKKKPLPENYNSLSLKDKLYHLRSDIPAITHVDYSARVQTVDGKENPRFQKLLKAFKKITGYGMLINTSFNVRGEPIVCSPKDAYQCFLKTEMDYIVLGDFLFTKEG